MLGCVYCGWQEGRQTPAITEGTLGVLTVLIMAMNQYLKGTLQIGQCRTHSCLLVKVKHVPCVKSSEANMKGYRSEKWERMDV